MVFDTGLHDRSSDHGDSCRKRGDSSGKLRSRSSELELSCSELEVPSSEVEIPSFEAGVPCSEVGVSSFKVNASSSVREALRSEVGIPCSEVGRRGLRGDRLLIPTDSPASGRESLPEQNGDRLSLHRSSFAVASQRRKYNQSSPKFYQDGTGKDQVPALAALYRH